jgi:hypothetical protein
MSLDRALEAAVEAGYLHDTAAQSSHRPTESTVNHLLEALGQEASGNKVYSAQDTGDAAELQQAEAERKRGLEPIDRGPIEDFGEKIEGARKDTFSGFRDALTEDVNVQTEPLSKSFPQPNYEKLAESGVSKRALAHIAIMRDMIPNKPRVPWKAKQWAEQVATLRSFARRLLDGEIDIGKMESIAKDMRALRDMPLTAQAIEDIAPKDLPKAAQYRVSSGSYSMLEGKRYSPHKTFWFLEAPSRRIARNPLSNDPARPYTYRETPEEAVALAKKIIEHELKQTDAGAQSERSKYTDVNVYRDRAKGEVFIGFKVRSSVIRLKAGFKDAQEARLYLADHRDDIQAQIDEMRKGPNMRGTENRPRSGASLREGDVTPDQFSQTFGFRGVQFGNYVEGPRRQADLNRAYDALMDLADVLDVPARALSLNGELGLAFGARGHGGRDAAAAHYEPGRVVINLTKGGGPGSLAHEWLHALDNYFARQDKATGYISERKRDIGVVRDEVYQAWKNIEASLKKGAFAERSAKFDETRSKPYWSTTIEKAARAFERYIIDRLSDKGTVNDYLANIDTSGGAYPTEKEMTSEGIRDAFDRLFNAIETQETDRGVAMFSIKPSTTETVTLAGGKKGEQHVLPGAEKIGARELAQRKADAPLKPDKPQKPADEGLFGSEKDQGSLFSLREGQSAAAAPSYEMRQALTDKFNDVADRVYPLLRAELDRLGLGDIGLKIADNIEFWINGKKRVEAYGVYFRRLVTLALEGTDGKGIASTLHHEAVHALRDLGLFTDGEWRLLSQESNRRWRKDFNIAEHYDGKSDEKQTEEGIAHAYAAWIAGQIKPDGRFVRLFKRIKNLLEALRNVFRGLGFKSAEDVFRDIKEGRVGARARAAADSEEPSFSVRTAEREPTPNLDRLVRDRIAAALEATKPIRDRFIEGTQDLSHPVKLLQDELERRREAAFEDPQSFYVRKRLYPGRLGAWVDTFNKRHLDPIVSLLKANDIDLQEAGDYLYALHAPERNAEMARINPGLEAGSGMTNEEAQKIINAAKASGHAAAYDELRQKVGAIRNLILDIMEQAGLEKPAVIDAWKKQYDDYVPLKGWEVTPEDAPPEFKGAGAGFQVRGQEIKRAFGRRSKADNPLVNVLDQAYRVFDRAERNRYLQSLYRAIDTMKEDAEDIATLDKGKAKKEIDPRTGLVRTVESSSQYYNPKAVYLKFDGNPHFIVFKDQQLAEAVRRMGPEGLGVFQPFLIMQNKIKALWTHYSPDFLLRHFLFRYPIEGTLNSFEQKETGNHSVLQYIKDSFPMLGNASKAILASMRGEVADDPRIRRLQKYWDEMRKAGGAMVFRNARDIDLTREHLETALKDLSDSPIQNARAKWRHTIEALDQVTNALDNALRLAAYASAREQGKTPQQAALIAREATVDFQVKGKWSSAIGMWFPFGNVAIQTGMRMTKAVYRSKIMRRVFLGTMLAGFLTSMFNYLVAGNDKDGVPFFEKIPEWDRRLNFIILNPFDKDAKGRPQPIKIPMQYNWAIPLVLGYAFGTQVFGKESVRKTISMVEKSLLEGLTPFGQEENKAAALTPELARPFVHVYTNEDWAGHPIHMDPRFQKRPNAESGKRTTGQGWQKIAEGVNDATGGSRSKSGMVDLYPEDYRELIGHFIGTQIRLGENLYETGSAIAKGQAPPATKTPLARVVHGTDYDAADRARAYELRDKLHHPWKR